MPDTHDERGGDEAAVRIAAMLKAYREDGDDEAVEIVHSGLYLTIGDLRELVRDRQQLAAATAPAEKAEAERDELRIDRDRCITREIVAKIEARQLRARLAKLGEPETQLRIIGPSGLVYTPTERDLEHRADWLPGVRLEERQVYPTPWRVAPDAAQDGLSATETLQDPFGVAFHGNTSSITPQGLSEAEVSE
jgi:hypothetical protein